MQSIFKGAIYSKLFMVILCFPLLTLGAKEIKYKVADIPKELRENARSVVRNSTMEFEVKSTSSATLKVMYAITVLNKNGLDDAIFSEYYDKFSKISGISGRIYDENGEQVKRIPSDEIIDLSAISGFSLYEDNRKKIIDPKVRTFPFTVEYSYEYNFVGLFIYPEWFPVLDYNISIEKSSYKIITPKNIPLRYYESNIGKKVITNSEGEKDIYLWEISSFKALQHEPFCPTYGEILPNVLAGPFDFVYGGYSGNMSSWENLGKWRFKLGENRNIVSEETQKIILALSNGLSTDFEKVTKIYEYMQNKVRYVSIKMGIGGLQPFEAMVVDKTSYGDCKALTNYMKSLLEIVNIKSNVVWVYAGNKPKNLIKDFPSFYFNHDFLCVPLKTDTIWLECTNQRMPCGYIGDFTDDRDVLLIDGENSKVVHTKAYTADDNTESRISYVKLTSVNGGEATVNANYKGLNYEQILPIYLSDDADKKRRIQNRISLPGFQLNTYAYTEHKAIIPSFDETLKLTFSNYGTASGQRVFLPLNFMNRLVNLPERVRNRKTDVLIRRPFTEIDTVVYELPANCEVEVLPAPVEIKTQFGTYTSKAEKVEGKLKYIRYYRLNKGKYPPTAYVDLLDFFEKISTADRLQCSLLVK